MSIRNEALEWYANRYGNTNALIHASKYFKAGESWTNSPVWWIEIPLTELNNNLGKSIHILCQKQLYEKEYYHLKVPCHFFIQNLGKLDVNKERISIFLSAERNSLMEDKRSKSNLSFAQFLLKES